MSGHSEHKIQFNIHRRLPLEVRLEIFGFLTHAQWIRLALHNHRTAKVLLGNLRYLAPLSRLQHIRFVCFIFLSNKLISNNIQNRALGRLDITKNAYRRYGNETLEV
jgi:hypothetical protein